MSTESHNHLVLMTNRPNQSPHRTAALRSGFGCAGVLGRRIRCRARGRRRSVS